jgi:hypothetical protein
VEVPAKRRGSFDDDDIDKSAWGEGPWQHEPDRVEFEHAGLPCLLLRNKLLGNWCGYAAVPPGHPLHGKGYEEVDIEVHGGLTYANACQGPICHVPKPGEPDDVWWFGFDCCHAGDLSPGVVASSRRHGLASFKYENYRDLAYIRSETEGLAEQLRSACEAAW